MREGFLGSTIISVNLKISNYVSIIKLVHVGYPNVLNRIRLLLPPFHGIFLYGSSRSIMSAKLKVLMQFQYFLVTLRFLMSQARKMQFLQTTTYHECLGRFRTNCAIDITALLFICIFVRLSVWYIIGGWNSLVDFKTQAHLI